MKLLTYLENKCYHVADAKASGNLFNGKAFTIVYSMFNPPFVIWH
jgi:hypothetical protein